MVGGVPYPNSKHESNGVGTASSGILALGLPHPYLNAAPGRRFGANRLNRGTVWLVLCFLAMASSRALSPDSAAHPQQDYHLPPLEGNLGVV